MKKVVLISSAIFSVGMIATIANEFTKPSARQQRKESVQKDTAFETCVKLCDKLMMQSPSLGEISSRLVTQLYSILRSCAVDGQKSQLESMSACELKDMQQKLEQIQKKIDELEVLITSIDKLI